ncbi:hypothetical protein RB653_005664 [Dictyostelium firmibasis]|uniref:Uncharacterized protein n=1 Tax=Dictyostelium firmibasis TaxID=79012 RepID=A0AAN7U8D0_9MYCE
MTSNLTSNFKNMHINNNDDNDEVFYDSENDEINDLVNRARSLLQDNQEIIKKNLQINYNINENTEDFQKFIDYKVSLYKEGSVGSCVREAGGAVQE